MDENFILDEKYPVSPMCDEHSTAIITEKNVDVTNIGTFIVGEQNSSIISFKINRYYDGVDLSEKKIKIMYRTSSDIFESEENSIVNVKYSQNSLKFSWIVPSIESTSTSVSSVSSRGTKLSAYICFISDDYLLKTKSFIIEADGSFGPENSEPSTNWFVTIEGKLDKIERAVTDNTVYDWAKQPEKPTYTLEELGAEKAGASDGVFIKASKYTDGEISRIENTVIPEKEIEINGKINSLSASVESLKNNKAEKVHSHTVSEITDFPESLPASDVYDWAKQEEKPSYTYEEVGALSSSTHIPSTLSEMKSDETHRTVSDKEKETWNNKSNFSGEYSDLKNIPEIKQLTDELKNKYDTAVTIANENKNTLNDKLNKAGYTSLSWIQTDENGNIIAGDKPKYTYDEVGALKADTFIPAAIVDLNDDESHRTVSDKEKSNWNEAVKLSTENKTEIQKKISVSGHVSDKWIKTDIDGNIITSDKPEYTAEEVHALPDTTHIPSSLAEMVDDEDHKTITSEERKKWNSKSDFSGSYNDLADIPEIKELTDELKLKYDSASELSQENKTELENKLVSSGYEANKWLQTDSSGNIVPGDKPSYTAGEIGAATEDHNHDEKYAAKSYEHTHENKEVLDGISKELIDSWNGKTSFAADVTDDGILKLTL